MKRKLYLKLLEWRNSPYRKPLILRGARQVGKSFLVREFGKTEFSNFIEINFELQPELKNSFQEKKPQNILKKLELILNRKIESENTILFLDEIQECPEAILSLRYFHDQSIYQTGGDAGVQSVSTASAQITFPVRALP